MAASLQVSGELMQCKDLPAKECGRSRASSHLGFLRFVFVAVHLKTAICKQEFVKSLVSFGK